MTRATRMTLAVTLSFLAGGGLVYLVQTGIVTSGGGVANGPARATFINLTDSSGACKVAVRRPQDIYAEPGSVVAWVVHGKCANSPSVAIQREVDSGGVVRDIFTADSTLETVAEQGRTIIGTLKDGLTTGRKGTKYEYTILINGHPAEFASPADRGALIACPSWPCKWN